MGGVFQLIFDKKEEEGHKNKIKTLFFSSFFLLREKKPFGERSSRFTSQTLA